MAATSTIASFPFELVENIILNLKITDILHIAAHIPAYWRSVIASSSAIAEHIANEHPLILQFADVGIHNDLFYGLRITTIDGGALILLPEEDENKVGIVLKSSGSDHSVSIVDLDATIESYSLRVSGWRILWTVTKLFDFEGEAVAKYRMGAQLQKPWYTEGWMGASGYEEEVHWQPLWRSVIVGA